MSDLRYDPVNDLWVAVSESRSQRPNEYRPESMVVPLATCPFCLGNELETPPTVEQFGWCEVEDRLLQGASKWLTRVVPNRFPAFGVSRETVVSADGPLGKAWRPPAQDSGDGHQDLQASIAEIGPYRWQSARGSRQELIIESPRHVESVSQLTPDELAVAFRVYRQRLREYASDPNLQFATLFKNCRPEAGASLSHIHSQLFGLDFLPRSAEEKFQRLEPADVDAEPLLRTLTQFELQSSQRVVQQTDDWAMFCPFASRFGYQTWITPRSGMRMFSELHDSAMDQLAGLIQRWVKAVETLVDRPAYNILFHGPPLRRPFQGDHFYVELFVRLGSPAGFEWAADCWINTLSPETAADSLRTVGLHEGRPASRSQAD